MKKFRRVLAVLLMFLLTVCMAACGAGDVNADYADAEGFEAALNAGDDLTGKTVQFTAMELHPDSVYGYDIWAGEHLNFISSQNPGIKAGDTVIVKATSIKSVIGSWIIEYKIVKNKGQQSAKQGKNVDYSGQEIEYCGYLFNIPDYYTDIAELGGENEDADDTQRFFMADNGFNGILSFTSDNVVITSNDYFMDNAKAYLKGFCETLGGSDISYYDSEAAGMPAKGAKFTGQLEELGEYDYNAVMFYDEKSKNIIGVVGAQSTNEDVKKDYLADVDNVLATCRPKDETGSNTVSAEAAKKDEIKPLVITDQFNSISSSYDGTAYVVYAGIINNPNNHKMAEFPKLTATVKDSDGSILGTGEQVGSYIMTNDTVTLIGMLTMPMPESLDGVTVEYNAECTDFIDETDEVAREYRRSSNFLISNISEKASGQYFITGEVKNTSEYDVDMVNVSLLLRKDGKIVYAENSFIDSLASKQTKAFQFQSFDGWPEHDIAEVSAIGW